MKHAPLILLSLLIFSGCSTKGDIHADAPLKLHGAVITTKIMGNGDRVDEFRVSGQLRMVKITPKHAPAYYLYDRNGDGHLDGDRNIVSPVYWNIYSWWQNALYLTNITDCLAYSLDHHPTQPPHCTNQAASKHAPQPMEEQLGSKKSSFVKTAWYGPT